MSDAEAPASDGASGARTYLVFNTIDKLSTQVAPVKYFENVAAHLKLGGHLVIEVGVPQLQRLPLGETVRALHPRPHTSASTSSTSPTRA
jgi:hypothetical protein